MWIQIFRKGTHTDSQGIERNFNDEDLEKIAQIYNQKVAESDSYEAPLVKGHPKTDAPAYGWVEKLTKRGNILFAKLKNLAPEIIDEIRKGRYKKVSIALYPDLLLRHIGLLGAVPPAVKGLKTVTFSEESDFLIFNSEEDNPTFENILITELKQENKKLQKEIDNLKKQLRLIEFSEFADNLIQKHNNLILPNQKDQIVEILEDSFLLEQSKMEFTEKTDLVSKIKSFLSSLISNSGIFDELKSSADINHNVDPQFFKNANPEKLAQHQQIIKIQRENPGLTYEEAFYKLNNV